jgi:hypothetical protein
VIEEEPDRRLPVGPARLLQELPAEEVVAAPQDPQFGHRYNVVVGHNVAAAGHNASAAAAHSKEQSRKRSRNRRNHLFDAKMRSTCHPWSWSWPPCPTGDRLLEERYRTNR